jgi:alkanesulfonate monooxygenase SsuD/methylene tetrahydromethanopterin reductase-like flavin-dependent oxidoreductase (luciferase family)
MKYGVVLPIWQLTIAEAESLTTRAESLGLDGVFVPDHILAKPPRPSITAGTGRTRSRSSRFSPGARVASVSAPA